MAVLITTVMEETAADLRERVGKLVTTDAAGTTTTPCVLVTPPRIEPNGTFCADRYSLAVLVIGLPGARAELEVLAELLQDVLTAVDELGWEWQLAEPVDFTPLNPTGAATPCQAYRITVERLY